MSDNKLANILKEMHVIAAINDRSILARDLMSSPMIVDKKVPIFTIEGAPSAALAYNQAIDEVNNGYLIFAHQDVYFPDGWEIALAKAIKTLEVSNPNWAVLAPFGISETTRRHVGQVWSTSLGGVIGEPIQAFEEVTSVDELVIVLKKQTGLRFDEGLPNFHMYGTDIVQEALKSNRGAFAAHLPVVHNDKFHKKLGHDFTQSYRFVSKKWSTYLPIRTPVVEVTQYGFPLFIQWIRMWKSVSKRRSIAMDVEVEPVKRSLEAGWLDLS